MTSLTSQTRWDIKFLKLANYLSSWSKDPSTKIGCVVAGPDHEIRSTGYNGFPRGVQDLADRLHDRDMKLKLICHAEENCILHAALMGVALKGCTSYCAWPPCTRCARSIINAGISTVVYSDKEIPERWQEDFDLSLLILSEGQVACRRVVLADPVE